MSPIATSSSSSQSRWPSLPFGDWRETCAALHRFSQIVGKYRLARTPWVNHSWHATLYVNATGLTTGIVPDDRGVEVTFDLRSHRLTVEAVGRQPASFALEAMSVADFLARFRAALGEAGATATFHGAPNEIDPAVPFADDSEMRPYDRDAVERFHQILVSCERVFQTFRTGFIGKVSPVHLFWGSFDLAVTRFSGKGAPLHPGGIPALPDAITREAYSHEVSSAGFWPGGGPSDEPAFYSYAYPAPEGFAAAAVEPAEATFEAGAGEFILPYEVVRSADDPERVLLAFLESTYQAAARLADWNTSDLQCPRGEPRRPRPLE